MKLTIPIALVALGLTLPASASAQETTEAVSVESEQVCAGDSGQDDLASALRVRLDDMKVVESRESSAPSPYRVAWTSSGGDSCRIVLSHDDSITEVALSEGAKKDAIRNAASRIAWVVSTGKRPRDPSERTENEAKEDVEDSDEEVDEQADEESTREEDAAAEEEASDEETSEGEQERKEPEEASDKEQTDDDGATDEEEETAVEETRVPFYATAIPLVSAPVVSGDRIVPNYAFNIIGYNYGLRGLEFGLLFNGESAYARGVQFAGIGNYVAGPVKGAQTSFGGNVAAGDVRGLQAALGGNLSLGAVDGAQTSAGVNWTSEKVNGFQLGALNVAGDVKGFQAALMNVGRDVDGVQAGFLNIAKESDVSVGLLNINWGRPAFLSVWANETGFTSLGLKHGSKYLHHLLAFRYSPLSNDPLLGVGMGLGGHFPLGSLYLEPDLLYNILLPSNQLLPNPPKPVHWWQMRGTLGWQIGRRIAVYAGLSANVRYSGGRVRLDPSGPVRSLSIGFERISIWPGMFAGMHF